MKLRELDARFLGNVKDGSARMQPGISGAQAVMFQCPLCSQGKERADGGGFKGAHYVRVCFANPQGAPVAPQEYDDNPRWTMTGTSLDDLTLSPSINLDVPWKDAQGVEHPSSCKWHGFVTNGDAT
jgi:hypothetical protein